jgi:ribokinase
VSVLHVVGNASVDMTLPVARLPLPGETLIATGSAMRAAGGKGLNQAIVAARTGARVRFLAPVGSELADIEAALAGESIEARLVGKGVPTDMSVLLVAASGQNAIVSTGACAEALTPAEVRAFLAPARADDLVLLQGNLSRAATEAALAGPARILLNLAPVRWGLPSLPAGSVLVVNEVEAGQLIDAAVEEAGRLLAGRGVDTIVTLGGEGAMLCRGGEVRRFAAPAAEVVDTTGAGDVFCGALAAGLLGGLGMAEAIGLGQVLAAISVGRAGCWVSFPSRNECGHAWQAVSRGVA